MASGMQHQQQQPFFDPVSLTDPALPNLSRPISPPTSVSHSVSHSQLLETEGGLRTRVNELEVINELFKGRIAELEASVAEARRAEAAARNTAEAQRGELAIVLEREAGLLRRVAELENAGQPRAKKARVSEDGLAGSDSFAGGALLPVGH